MFVAVHVGAGYHSPRQKPLYKNACVKACRAARNQTDTVSAVIAAISSLEDDPCTNAGLGSNLTIDGNVECDASVMEGDGSFGAVGAVPCVKNPIMAAHKVMEQGRKILKFGRIPPMLLVSTGAANFAVANGLQLVGSEYLITPKQRETYSGYMEKFKSVYSSGYNVVPPQTLSDTVGVVCIDQNGRAASGVSSGGIWLKHPGRVGEAALFGTGCYALDQRFSGNSHSIACSVSGTGEQIVKTMIASKVAELAQSSFDDEAETLDERLSKFLQKDIMESPLLRMYDQKNVGLILVLRSHGTTETDLCCAHTTPSMAIAWQGPNMQKPKFKMSRKSEGSHSVIFGANA